MSILRPDTQNQVQARAARGRDVPLPPWHLKSPLAGLPIEIPPSDSVLRTSGQLQKGKLVFVNDSEYRHLAVYDAEDRDWLKRLIEERKA